MFNQDVIAAVKAAEILQSCGLPDRSGLARTAPEQVAEEVERLRGAPVRTCWAAMPAA